MSREIVYVFEVESLGKTLRAVRSYDSTVAAAESAKMTRIGYGVLREYHAPAEFHELILEECTHFIDGPIKDIGTLDEKVQKIMGR
jgi:hypothetical protein